MPCGSCEVLSDCVMAEPLSASCCIRRTTQCSFCQDVAEAVGRGTTLHAVAETR